MTRLTKRNGRNITYNENENLYVHITAITAHVELVIVKF